MDKIIMTMRGMIVVLFGFPLCLNVGLSRGLVPGLQLVVGDWTLLWVGYEPFQPHVGQLQSGELPLFMIAMTTTNLSLADSVPLEEDDEQPVQDL